VSYRQLTLEERYQIAAMRKRNFSFADIAREIGRHRTTIARECERNAVTYSTFSGETFSEYKPGAANRQARQRRVEKGLASRKIQGALQYLVEQKLKLSWSPEQICGRLWLEHRLKLTAETIYQHVIRDTHERKGLLRYCLRFAGYTHKRFKKSKMGERSRRKRNRLESRPKAADKRSELGHWERDCLLGSRGGPAVLTLVDRRSRYVKLRYLESHDVPTVSAATFDALIGEPKRSVTNDNGFEFREYETLQETLGTKVYFCDPSSPWQRGSVENVNGLIRQYFKKGRILDRDDKAMVSMIEETLNNRPRKTLGYRTPLEAHTDEDDRLMRPDVMQFGLEYCHCQ